MEDFIALGCSDLEGSSADAAQTARSNSRTSEGLSGMQQDISVETKAQTQARDPASLGQRSKRT